jgi:hypothetical protein
MTQAGSSFDYYVSLDLGSESMAAYYQHARSGQAGMVELQEYASELLGQADVDYLQEEDGSRSPRLRTRIGLNNDRQPAPLPDSHALLDFVDDYGKKLPGYDESLFTYFFSRGGGVLGELLPNPKVPFQEGGQSVIPKVLPKGAPAGREVSYPAEKLLQHLTVQVIRNFVLRSPQLKGVPSDRIHLTLTAPNVYSVTHAESIKHFVQQHIRFHDVQVLYESDAVAYFIYSDDNRTPKKIKDFKKRLLKRKGETLRIVTIDIGRGTSDLSLIQIEKPKKAGEERRHYVQARTGKSSGGNGLSYIFAQYFNERYKEVLSEYEGLLPQTPTFNLLESETGGSITGAQRTILRLVETHINKLKANIGEDYRLKMDDVSQRNSLEEIIITILKEVDPNYQQGADVIQDQFRAELLEAFVLPARRLTGGRHSLFWQRLLTRFPKRVAKRVRLADLRESVAERVRRADAILALQENIEQYVRENIDLLLEQLMLMAVERDNHHNGNRRKIIKKIFDPGHTFVLIAGQAGQFKPIRRAIRERFEVLGFSDEKILSIDGALAKEACCIGAAVFQAALNKAENPYELHGVYGFLGVAVLDPENYFRKVDMAQVRKGGKATVSFTEKGAYRLIYSPNPALSDKQPPELYDGFTALIDTFPGSEFVFEYDQNTQEIKVDGRKLDKVANYGDFNESIYPKVWPEVVKRK